MSKVALLALAAGLQAQSFDLADSFSATANPNGPWAYGWSGTVGGVFTAITVPFVSGADGGAPIPSWQLSPSQTPAVYKNTSGAAVTVGGGLASFPSGTVWFYPGSPGSPENFGVIRFKVPTGAAGGYLLKSDLAPVYPSFPQGDTDIHIALNGVEIFGQFLAPTDAASFSSVVSLRVGDVIDFAIGRGADGSDFGSGLRISATLTATNSTPPPPPVPSSIHKLSDGFAAGANPNGPWAYGWKGTIGGSFTKLGAPWVSFGDGGVTVPSWQLTTFQTPAVYKNTSGGTITLGGGLITLPAETIFFYPGEDGRPENFGVIRFTVPAGQSGHYLVRSSVSPVYPSFPQGDTDFHIVRNGKEFFRKFLSPTQSAFSTVVLRLRAGSTVDFMIGRGADGSAFGSGLRIKSTLTLLRPRDGSGDDTDDGD